MVVVLTTCAVPPSLGATPDTIANRSEDPVIIPGSQLPEVYGTSVNAIGVAKYDAAQGAFVPIPFQVDQRFNHLVNPGDPNPVYELMYDVLHEDNGLFDEDDEIALQYSDAGTQAPLDAWVPGADPNRFEIRITDPRPEGPRADRFVYVFTGFGLIRSPVSYVTWPTTPVSDVMGGRLDLDFNDRWLLTGLRIPPPCGTAADLIDRVKGRAGATITHGESEESWNLTSLYLGGIVGPVRAIRYVRGAASGINTVHHDIVYRGFWERIVNVRIFHIP